MNIKIAGSIQEKSNRFYTVISIQKKKSRRIQKWESTGLTIRGNKKKANDILEERKSIWKKIINKIEVLNTLTTEEREEFELLDNKELEILGINYTYTENVSEDNIQQNCICENVVNTSNCNTTIQETTTPKITQKIYDNVPDNIDIESGHNLKEEIRNKTLYEYLEYWTTNIGILKEDTTYNSYCQMLHCRIEEFFNDKKQNRIPIRHLDAVHIVEFINYLIKQKLSASSRLNYFHFINKALEYAKKSTYLKDNICNHVTIEKYRASEFKPTFYSKEELVSLFNEFENNVLYPVVLLTAIYGFRRSEVIGLKWEDIDFENKCITVQRKAVYSSKNGDRQLIIKNSTKTKAGYRTLPLIPIAENLLKKLKILIENDMELYKEEYNSTYLGHIFVWDDGRLISPDYVTKAFKKIVRKTSLRDLRFHDLRHTCASLLLKQNIHLRSIQDWLGHSSYQSTLRYSHLDSSAKVESGKQLHNIFNNINVEEHLISDSQKILNNVVKEVS